MGKTHKEFEQELKFVPKITETSDISEEEKCFLEYKKQRIKNKYDNWILKRQKEGKDCNIELFIKLQNYFEREQQQLQECIEMGYNILESKSIVDDEYFDDSAIKEARKLLEKWRQEDSEYQEMKEDIEELRYVKDSPVVVLESSSR